MLAAACDSMGEGSASQETPLLHLSDEVRWAPLGAPCVNALEFRFSGDAVKLYDENSGGALAMTCHVGPSSTNAEHRSAHRANVRAANLVRVRRAQLCEGSHAPRSVFW